MNPTASIVSIAGSPSAPSRSAALLNYLHTVIQEQTSAVISLITVRDLNHSALITGDFDDPSIDVATGMITDADGVIVATPVYKAAYSGVLKVLLDLLPQNALAGKVILPIVSGGAPGHMLALDYALKPVLAALGAGQILNGVYLIDSQYDYSEGKIMRFHDVGAETKLREAALAFIKAIEHNKE
ncbi:MAG: NADPH-dependent FMN reductase [Anaerolineae bacterium]|nr:NADPH-dependent FMN reductase [Anaerolineae bacterium]